MCQAAVTTTHDGHGRGAVVARGDLSKPAGGAARRFQYHVARPNVEFAESDVANDGRSAGAAEQHREHAPAVHGPIAQVHGPQTRLVSDRGGDGLAPDPALARAARAGAWNFYAEPPGAAARHPVRPLRPLAHRSRTGRGHPQVGYPRDESTSRSFLLERRFPARAEDVPGSGSAKVRVSRRSRRRACASPGQARLAGALRCDSAGCPVRNGDQARRRKHQALRRIAFQRRRSQYRRLAGRGRGGLRLETRRSRRADGKASASSEARSGGPRRPAGGLRIDAQRTSDSDAHPVLCFAVEFRLATLLRAPGKTRCPASASLVPQREPPGNSRPHPRRVPFRLLRAALRSARPPVSCSWRGKSWRGYWRAAKTPRSRHNRTRLPRASYTARMPAWSATLLREKNNQNI